MYVCMSGKVHHLHEDSSKGFDAPRWVPQLDAAATIRTLLFADEEARPDIIRHS